MNKLEVYFSKLPKSCFECPCFKIVQCRGDHNVFADNKIFSFVHKWQKEKLNKLKVV